MVSTLSNDSIEEYFSWSLRLLDSVSSTGGVGLLTSWGLWMSAVSSSGGVGGVSGLGFLHRWSGWELPYRETNRAELFKREVTPFVGEVVQSFV